YDCGFIVDRESTRHDWCSFGKLCKSSEINSPLSDLHHLLLALALIVLVGVLPWIRLLGLRAILGEMGSTATIETSIVTVPAIELWGIWPWAKLLWLLKDWRSESSLLLRRPKNKLACWGISLWSSWWSILYQMIPWWLSTRGSCWCLSLLLGAMYHDTIFLSNGHIDQLIISIWLNKIQAFLELGIEATMKTVALLGVSIRMMARVLAQMIEGLCILKNSAGPLIQSQEFIQLPLNQSLGNMMCPKGILEFHPR